METRNILDPAADIETKIKEYFGETDCSVQIFMVGSIADAIISYKDFKPVRQVRRELEDAFPDLNIGEIHRSYSNSSRLAVMQELLDADEQIFLPYADGSLRPICLNELVEERLYHRILK